MKKSPELWHRYHCVRCNRRLRTTQETPTCSCGGKLMPVSQAAYEMWNTSSHPKKRHLRRGRKSKQRPQPAELSNIPPGLITLTALIDDKPVRLQVNRIGIIKTTPGSLTKYINKPLKLLRRATGLTVQEWRLE